MFTFHYNVKVNLRIKAKCDKHPRYNPEKDGKAGIKGGCLVCQNLLDLYQARQAHDAAQEKLQRLAAPWRQVRARRTVD